jgi:hypothetical protein
MPLRARTARCRSRLGAGLAIAFAAAALLLATGQLPIRLAPAASSLPVQLRRESAPFELDRLLGGHDGFEDHLSDIVDLTSVANRAVDLRAWKRRVDFLARQASIEYIRVDMPALETVSLVRGRLVWNQANLKVYGAAFNYARARRLSIILVAMPPLRVRAMTDAAYGRMVRAYYDTIARFATAHRIADINLNELAIYDPATGGLLPDFTPAYLARMVALVTTASSAAKALAPKARIIVSESAGFTDETTRRLLGLFGALKTAGVSFIRGLNVYAGGPVEIAEIPWLVAAVRRDGEVWVTEFGVASYGQEDETVQARKLGQIFEEALRAGVGVVIGYEEMDEPRLQNRPGVSPAEKHFGILWRQDGSLKPAAEVFLAIARGGEARAA